MASKIVWTSDCGKHRIVVVDEKDLNAEVWAKSTSNVKPHPVVMYEVGGGRRFPRVADKVVIFESSGGEDALGVQRWDTVYRGEVDMLAVALVKRLL